MVGKSKPFEHLVNKFVLAFSVNMWTNLDAYLDFFDKNVHVLILSMGHIVFLRAYLIKHNITDDIFVEFLKEMSMPITFSQL